MSPILQSHKSFERLKTCRLVAAVLFWICVSVAGASAQRTYFLPQVVDGSYGSRRYKTTFVLFNNTSTKTTAILELTDDSGSPLLVTIGAQTDSRFAVEMAPGASRVLQTSGRGSLVSGAAKVTSPTSIGVSAAFSVCDA